jgi:hypothetical protein
MESLARLTHIDGIRGLDHGMSVPASAFIAELIAIDKCFRGREALGTLFQ